MCATISTVANVANNSQRKVQYKECSGTNKNLKTSTKSNVIGEKNTFLMSTCKSFLEWCSINESISVADLENIHLGRVAGHHDSRKQL